MEIGPRVFLITLLVTGWCLNGHAIVMMIVLPVVLNILQVILNWIPECIENLLMRIVEYYEKQILKLVIKLWNGLIKLGQFCLTLRNYGNPPPPPPQTSMV